MCFLTSPLASDIFLSVSLVFFSKSDLPVSYLVFKTNPLLSIVFTFATNLSYAIFLTTSLFTTLISLLKSTGAVFTLPVSIFSTSGFKLAKSNFADRLDV